MNLFILFIVIVILGAFGVLVTNNTKKKADVSQFTDAPLSIPTQKTNTPPPKQSVSPTNPPQNALAPQLSSPVVATVSAPLASKATIQTSKGDIVLILYPEAAPRTVENFVNKAKSGFYKDLTFHRVEDWVVQGGDPKGNGTGGGQMRTELNNKPFVVGSLGVARGPDINVSNDAQFFITKKEASWLNQQYTNFGMVETGMGVVEKLEIGDMILGITLQ